MPFFKHFKDIKLVQEGHMGCVRRFRGWHIGCVRRFRGLIWGA
jgi:hypothetical protein